MNECWQKFLPFMMQGDWGGYSKRSEDDPLFEEYYNNWRSHNDMWVKPLSSLKIANNPRFRRHNEFKTRRFKAELEGVIEAIKALASSEEIWNNRFIKRDAIDIIRTALGRSLNLLLASAMYDTDSELVSKKKDIYFRIHDTLKSLLSPSDDFSVYKTLLYIQSVAPTNPRFEKTLKQNISCSYCRQYALELMDSLFRKEATLVFDWMLDGKDEDRVQELSDTADKIHREFMETPLELLSRAPAADATEIARKASDCMKLLFEVL